MKERFILTEDLLADKGLRFANFIIDLVIRFALEYLLAILIAVTAKLAGADGFLQWMINVGFWEELIFGIFVTLLYYNVMEITTGQTAGKLITGTSVVDYNGEKPDASTILTRSLCRIIPLEPLSFLGDGRGWHDSIPDVYVVRKKDLREAIARHNELESFGESNETDPV